MEIKFNKDENLEKRLNFIRSYVKRIKSVDNEDQSSQQVDFINSLFDNSKNFWLDAYVYLKLQNKTPKKQRQINKINIIYIKDERRNFNLYVTAFADSGIYAAFI
ncbi:MAG: hypothetical protein QMD06_00060 [Candidatus Altarchaeum sp.]|nr:hypothetical protein [Candidatus Altarchaeum sp.]